jgi:hypothetical protein
MKHISVRRFVPDTYYRMYRADWRSDNRLLPSILVFFGEILILYKILIWLTTLMDLIVKIEPLVQIVLPNQFERIWVKFFPFPLLATLIYETFRHHMFV